MTPLKHVGREPTIACIEPRGSAASFVRPLWGFTSVASGSRVCRNSKLPGIRVSLYPSPSATKPIQSILVGRFSYPTSKPHVSTYLGRVRPNAVKQRPASCQTAGDARGTLPKRRPHSFGIPSCPVFAGGRRTAFIPPARLTSFHTLNFAGPAKWDYAYFNRTVPTYMGYFRYRHQNILLLSYL